MNGLARSGARAPALKAEAVIQGQQYLTFTVTGESFGIRIASIKEIIEYRMPTEVPMMPGYMRGIINLRGRVLPVIDLAVRFGRSALAETRRSCIVILEVRENDEQHDIGVMVDAVSAVVEIADADVEPPPSFGANMRIDFISGMGKIGERFVILLDIGKVLSVGELATLRTDEGAEAPARAHSAAPHLAHVAAANLKAARTS
jgi:purine-binding chemotaxis protein CheW